MREHAYGSMFDVLPPPVPTLARRVVAEGFGTAVLAAAVVGSGIAAERLSGGNTGLALLANSIATGATLAALILALGGISGAHFNPVVSMVRASSGDLTPVAGGSYILAQCAGALAGVVGANIMFGEPAIAWSSHARAGLPNGLSEVIATFGLVATICGCASRRPDSVAFAVGAYIVGAYWFTVSTSFANPALTLARAATDTFTGIRPLDVPAFVAAQLVGAAGAAALFRWLIDSRPAVSQPG